MEEVPAVVVVAHHRHHRKVRRAVCGSHASELGQSSAGAAHLGWATCPDPPSSLHIWGPRVRRSCLALGSHWVRVQARTACLRRQRCCGASVPGQRSLDQRAQSQSSPARRVTGGVPSTRCDRRKDEGELQHKADRGGEPSGGSTSPFPHHCDLRSKTTGFEPQVLSRGF